MIWCLAVTYSSGCLHLNKWLPGTRSCAISKVCKISDFHERHLAKWHISALSQVVSRTVHIVPGWSAGFLKFLALSGHRFVGHMLCTTSTVQRYIMHHRPPTRLLCNTHCGDSVEYRENKAYVDIPLIEVNSIVYPSWLNYSFRHLCLQKRRYVRLHVNVSIISLEISIKCSHSLREVRKRHIFRLGYRFWKLERGLLYDRLPSYIPMHFYLVTFHF